MTELKKGESYRRGYSIGYKEALERAIKLSDKIEAETHHTEFNEWRAFKGFRNELRDLLK